MTFRAVAAGTVMGFGGSAAGSGAGFGASAAGAAAESVLSAGATALDGLGSVAFVEQPTVATAARSNRAQTFHKFIESLLLMEEQVHHCNSGAIPNRAE
jgi:hypothetical protein